MDRNKTDTAVKFFLLPATVVYLSVIIFPVLYSLYLSLFSGSGIQNWQFSGLQNYVSLLSDSIFVSSFKNSMIWMILTLVVTTGISLLLAVLLNRSFPGRTFLRGLFYFPSVVSMIAVAFIWRWIYHPVFGFINQSFEALGLGIKQSWLSDAGMSLIACFIAAQWQAIGQPMILFLAGLQTIPEDVLEAARIDGASDFRCFLSIKIPLLRETFVIVISTLMISALKLYDIIFGLTNGGPNNASQVLATYMYSQTFDYNHWGYGAAIACVMVLMMAFIVIPYVRFTSRNNQ